MFSGKVVDDLQCKIPADGKNEVHISNNLFKFVS